MHSDFGCSSFLLHYCETLKQSKAIQDSLCAVKPLHRFRESVNVVTYSQSCVTLSGINGLTFVL